MSAASVVARRFLPATGWEASQIVASGSISSKTLAGSKNGAAGVIWSERRAGVVRNIYLLPLLCRKRMEPSRQNFLAYCRRY